MFLTKTLLTKRVHDATLKQVAEVGYDIDRIDGKTETGGLYMNGDVGGTIEQTITTGGTAQALINWTGSYSVKTIVANAAAGTLVTTAALTFDLQVEGYVGRPPGSTGEVEIFLVSDLDGDLDSFKLSRTQQVSKVLMSVPAGVLQAANTLTLEIRGATVTGQVYTLEDMAFFAESAT